MGHLAKNLNIKSNIGQKILSGVQTASAIAGTIKHVYEVIKLGILLVEL